MSLLQRLPFRRESDPYWDGFVNRPLADPAHDLATAIRNAHEGKVFPVESDVPPPDRMARDLAELARFLGAARFGVAATSAAYLRLRPSEDGGKVEDEEALAAAHPFLLVCVVPAQYDPAEAQGMAGRAVAQKSASVCFTLAAYIRELGYRGMVTPIDSCAAAVAAGLGNLARDGRLSVPGYGSKVYVGDGVLTDLPLVPGCPAI